MRQVQYRSFEANYDLCLERLNWAILQLSGRPDPGKIAETAELIIQTMSGVWRFFHTPEHIFEVGKSGDAIEVLSALFHDSIHVQADVGVDINIGRVIAPYVREDDKCLCILSASRLPDDPTFALVCQIFGFEPEQMLLPNKGQNEFLSALVAGKCLEHALGGAVIAQIAACIEVTIPFRPRSIAGQTSAEQLRARLVGVNERFTFGWSLDELDTAVRRAVRLANRDVENFSHESTATFLDNTWNLMPETNHDLIGNYSYTVSGYRTSLQKMESFMSLLSPELVFQKYQDEPSATVYKTLLDRTQKNLEIARLYLGSKLLSIAAVEALSQRLGTNIPLATMMGELSQRGLPEAQIERFLPVVCERVEPQSAMEAIVLELLEQGRTESSNYDAKNSPVATYIIKALGFSESLRLLGFARDFFKGNISGEEFLERCSPEVVDTIVRGVLGVFEVRAAALARTNRPRSPEH
jgi:hypothetical protein